jgi:hypothetical protein
MKSGGGVSYLLSPVGEEGKRGKVEGETGLGIRVDDRRGGFG